VTQDIKPDSSAKSAPIGSESPKVDKPPSPPAEKTAPEPPKPPSPKDTQGSPGVGGAPPSPTHAASGQNPTGTSSGLESSKSPEASSPSPWSYGLRAAGGYQHGEGSSVPQSEEPLQHHSWVAESLWDNPEFIQAGFHIERFETAVVDIKANQENVKPLYSSMKTFWHGSDFFPYAGTG
jgi:hypothetical protein